jgi:hypothetical protein
MRSADLAKEALRCRVVATIADFAYAAGDVVIGQEALVVAAGELHAPIGMLTG